MFVLDRVGKTSALKAMLCTGLAPPESPVLTEGLSSPKQSAYEVKFQVPLRDTHARRRASVLERLVNLVVGSRATADVGIARAVDEAFASLAREYRR